MRAMEAVHEVYVSDTFTDHVVEIVTRTRNHPRIELGSSPRAGIALIKGSRARALIHGRNYVIPEDLFALAEDVILHRIRLTYEALADGYTGADRPQGDHRAVRAGRANQGIEQRPSPVIGTVSLETPMNEEPLCKAESKLTTSSIRGSSISP